MNKISLFSNPLETVKLWWQLHNVSLKLCGEWFGLIMFPNGKVIIRNKQLIEFISTHVHKINDVENLTE